MDNKYNPYENTNDMQNENNRDPNPYGYNPHGQFTPLKPRNGFETASMVCGFACILTCTCIYGSYILGALAIIFALLSRGGQMKMSSKAKLGLILGIVGLVMTTVFYAVAFYIAIEEYGSIEEILREYCRMAGLNFEEVSGDMFQ